LFNTTSLETQIVSGGNVKIREIRHGNINAVRSNHKVKDFYERLIFQEKSAKIALNVVAKKWDYPIKIERVWLRSLIFRHTAKILQNDIKILIVAKKSVNP
jgi:hypothetical protein